MRPRHQTSIAVEDGVSFCNWRSSHKRYNFLGERNFVLWRVIVITTALMNQAGDHQHTQTQEEYGTANH